MPHFSKKLLQTFQMYRPLQIYFMKCSISVFTYEVLKYEITKWQMHLVKFFRYL